MRNIKCSDCAEYRNEWCEKIVDSPHPDMLRDCQYWHERKDMVEVIRCKDCKHYYFAENRVPEEQSWVCDVWHVNQTAHMGYCFKAERKSDE